MQQRTLGNQGLRVSAIGLGCMVMSKSYWPADEQESLATSTVRSTSASPS
jgi:aryl-alcohol dehydrogenase-like predicted oxidoreductase